MGRSDDRSDQDPSTRRQRWTWATVVTIGVVSASVLVAVPAIASSDGAEPARDEPSQKIVVCESGVIDHGDGIQTSSAKAERVAADAPVPEGCTAR